MISSNKTKGFTLVELLIVIVVIAILAAISIVAYNGVTNKARDDERAKASIYTSCAELLQTLPEQKLPTGKKLLMDTKLTRR